MAVCARGFQAEGRAAERNDTDVFGKEAGVE